MDLGVRKRDVPAAHAYGGDPSYDSFQSRRVSREFPSSSSSLGIPTATGEVRRGCAGTSRRGHGRGRGLVMVRDFHFAFFRIHLY